MPIKMSLGLTKKLGLPAYSSVGASCHVECEVDSSALEQDGQRFHQEAERLFGLCRQAVQEQLARELPAGAQRQPANGHNTPQALPKPDYQEEPADEGEMDDQEEPQPELGLSERQLIFIQNLASQIRGLGIRRLPALVAFQFDKNLTELSSPEASRLIDLLRRVRAGNLALDALMEQE
jgi:hypothetical protein